MAQMIVNHTPCHCGCSGWCRRRRRRPRWGGTPDPPPPPSCNGVLQEQGGVGLNSLRHVPKECAKECRVVNCCGRNKFCRGWLGQLLCTCSILQRHMCMNHSVAQLYRVRSGGAMSGARRISWLDSHRNRLPAGTRRCRRRYAACTAGCPPLRWLPTCASVPAPRETSATCAMRTGFQAQKGIHRTATRTHIAS